MKQHSGAPLSISGL